MSSTLMQFVKNVQIAVLVVELPPCIVNAIVGLINPRSIDRKKTEQEFNAVIDR